MRWWTIYFPSHSKATVSHLLCVTWLPSKQAAVLRPLVFPAYFLCVSWFWLYHYYPCNHISFQVLTGCRMNGSEWVRMSAVLPRWGPWQWSRLQLDVGLLGTGGTAASVVWISKHITSLDCKEREYKCYTKSSTRLTQCHITFTFFQGHNKQNFLRSKVKINNINGKHLLVLP